MAHNHWQTFKLPDMQNFGIRDDIGFGMTTTDRDGWRARRVVKVLNAGEEALEADMAGTSVERTQEGGDAG